MRKRIGRRKKIKKIGKRLWRKKGDKEEKDYEEETDKKEEKDNKEVKDDKEEKDYKDKKNYEEDEGEEHWSFPICLHSAAQSSVFPIFKQMSPDSSDKIECSPVHNVQYIFESVFVCALNCTQLQYILILFPFNWMLVVVYIQILFRLNWMLVVEYIPILFRLNLIMCSIF